MKKNYLLFLFFIINYFGFSQTGTHLNFDGNQDKAQIYIYSLDSYSLEFWIKPTNLTGEHDIFSSENYFYRRLWLDNGVLKAGRTDIPSTILADNVAVPLNTWTHVALTVSYNNNETKMYKNGVLVATNNSIVTLNESFLGAKLNTDVVTFEGGIDEVRIWTKVLSQEDIIGRMNCELRGDEEGLYRYYNFNQGIANGTNSTENYLYDVVSATYPGALIDFALTGTTSNWVDGSIITSGITNPYAPTTTTLIEYNLGDIASPLSASIGSGGVGLFWYNSVTGTGSTTAITPDTSTLGTFNYWVATVNANGCESERIKITVKVNPTINYGCWKAIDTSAHTLAIAEDGTLWSWGTNSNGQLGLGDTTDRTVPTQVGTDTNWESIVTCASHSLAIKTDGTLWSWGANSNGQLGLGDNTNRNMPTQIGIDTDWKTLGRGFNSTIVLKQNGTLWVSGANNYGQLGLNDTTDRNVIIQVGTDTDWKEISNSFFVTLAIKSNGMLWASGGATYNGMSINTHVFTQVNSETNWHKVYTGFRVSYALKTDGTLWSSGVNTNNDLGRPNPAGSYFQQIGGSNWAMVAPGFRYVLAIKNDGSLWAWGDLAKSIFGLSGGSGYTPNQIGNEYNWKEVYTTTFNSAALKDNNSAWLGKNAPFAKVDCPCDQTTIWDGVTWSNGLPSSNTQVIFNGDYTGNGFSACTVAVNGTSVVTINSNESVQVEGAITVNSAATFEFLNNANLIQIRDDANTGNIILHRESAPMIRQDYTAWSAPVVGQNLQSFSPQTLTNRFYTYEPSGTTTATAWIPVDPSTTNFEAGKGVLIRVANNWSSTVYTPFDGTFTGVPNNGVVSQTVQTGYNLIGNPYASPIDAKQFIQENSATINGSIYFWTHTIPASGGVYPVNNYASYSLAGGVAAASGGSKPTSFIQTGQGFFVDAMSSGTVNFDNSMRKIQASNLFFRTSEPVKDRFWLNLVDETTSYNQILVAYMENATNNFDNGIDAKLLTNSSNSLSSIINEEQYVIQGKSSFDDNDEVPLGFVANQNGNFTISLDSVEGIFSNQDIYLWDKNLNIYHDIKQAGYNFNSIAGTFNDRFSIVYKSLAMSNEEFNNHEQVLIYIDNSNQIVVKNDENLIDSVEIFDLTGRLLYNNSNVGKAELIKDNNFSTNVLLVRAKSKNNKLTTRKLIKK